MPLELHFDGVCFSSLKQPSGGSPKKVFFKFFEISPSNLIEKDYSADVFLRILRKFLRIPFFRNQQTTASELLLQ